MINNMTKEQLNKIDGEFERASKNNWNAYSLKCWKSDCKNIATGQDGAGWEWCGKHFDQEDTGSVFHTKQKEYDIDYYSKIIHSKLQEAYELGREEAYNFLEQQYEVSKRIEDRIRKDERERIIEIMNNLEAPDCIDDNCEYIHDGYFKALEDLTKSLQTNKE